MAQQQVHHQPWWAGPLQGIGSVLQGMQQKVQQFAGGFDQQSTARSPTRHSSVTLSTAVWPQGALYSSEHHFDSSSTAIPSWLPSDASSLGTSSSSSSSHPKQSTQQPVTKEELGRATWVFLHTLAAQFPEHPSRQQQRDARQLIDSLTRIYPCGDCAQHFQEIVKRDPPAVDNGRDFSLWMCRTHNAVNRRLGKAAFNCDLAAARWAPLDCDEHNSCDMTVGRKK